MASTPLPKPIRRKTGEEVSVEEARIAKHEPRLVPFKDDDFDGAVMLINPWNITNPTVDKWEAFQQEISHVSGAHKRHSQVRIRALQAGIDVNDKEKMTELASVVMNEMTDAESEAIMALQPQQRMLRIAMLREALGTEGETNNLGIETNDAFYNGRSKELEAMLEAFMEWWSPTTGRSDQASSETITSPTVSAPSLNGSPMPSIKEAKPSTAAGPRGQTN